MKKRLILSAAILICCSFQLQVNAQTHDTNVNAENKTYKDYKDSDGGALKIEQGHINSVTGSAFENNTANNHGGALYNAGNVTVNNSTFKENKAEQSGGKGYGGAIYNTGDLTVDGSSFTKNI